MGSVPQTDSSTQLFVSAISFYSSEPYFATLANEVILRILEECTPCSRLHSAAFFAGSLQKTKMENNETSVAGEEKDCR
jgi:hypothetical protein